MIILTKAGDGIGFERISASRVRLTGKKSLVMLTSEENRTFAENERKTDPIV